MDELLKMVSDRTGLPPDKAAEAVKTVVEYIKAKLPGPIAGQIDGVISGGASTSQSQGVVDGLGGLFGRQ